MGRVLFAGGKSSMTAPTGAVKLNALTEGSIVKINENGTPVDFYIAKHNYESALNGEGRTLLIRSSSLITRGLFDDDSTKNNDYDVADINTYFENTYKPMFAESVQALIGTTNFYYTKRSYYSNNYVTTMSAPFFIASLTELGITSTDHNVEGSKIPIIATVYTNAYNGTRIWTRTSKIRTEIYFYTSSGGTSALAAGFAADRLIIPMLTLPETTVFDINTLICKE